MGNLNSRLSYLLTTVQKTGNALGLEAHALTSEQTINESGTVHYMVIWVVEFPRERYKIF